MTASIQIAGGTALFARSAQRSPLTERHSARTLCESDLPHNDDRALTHLAISRWEAEGGALPKA
ncbi:hypothetical protein A5765_20130 [Mycolicibacterium celeriflavum]|nr:hypothetical protein A5765_20130 [Mycolicibacterium celeriflavum]